MNSISLREIIGGAYEEFWNFKGRYRVVKGGRGSKKSTTTSLWIIYNMMYFYCKYGLKPYVLVLRKVLATHQTSTFNQLRWAINRLGVGALWKATKNPLQLVFIPSGQAIYFRGLDDPQSITSITADDGYLCWTWIEEAYQITNEDDFNKIDMSIRGELPAPLFKQHTLTLNPWSDKSWIKRRFFDIQHDDTLAFTRNYDCNEFLGDDDRAIFTRMRLEQPKRYAVEGRGEWGISEGLVFDRWEVKEFNPNDLICQCASTMISKPRYIKRFGLDFGFSNDPCAFIALLIDEERREIYVCAEFYRTGMVIEDIYKEICDLGCQSERIVCDSALPNMIEELRKKGLHGVRGAKKGPNSILDGIARLQDYKIYIHPSCRNAEAEFSTYAWKTDPHTGISTGTPVDESNHIIDAMRYATEDLIRQDFRWAKL